MTKGYFVEPHNRNDSSLEILLFNGINTEAVRAKKLSPIQSFGFSIKEYNGLGGFAFLSKTWIYHRIYKRRL